MTTCPVCGIESKQSPDDDRVPVIANGGYVVYDGTMHTVTEYDGVPRLHALIYDGQPVVDFEWEPGANVSLDLENGEVVVITREELNAL